MKPLRPAFPLLGAWFVLALFFGAGCATKTTVSSIQPAEVSLGSVRTLAVLPFEGEYGGPVCAEFTTRLTDVDHFSLVDPTRMNTLDKVAYNQVEDPRLLPGFKRLMADAVVTGRVEASVEDETGQDLVDVKVGTGQYKKEKNLFGQEVDVEIMRTVKRPVKYVIRKASLSASIKVFDLATKKIVVTDRVTESVSEKYGGDHEYKGHNAQKLAALPAKNALLEDLAKKAALELAGKISPSRVHREVAFAGGNSDVDKGIEFARRGLFDDAVEIWEAETRKDPENHAAWYDLGVAYESRGDLAGLERAREMYRKAARLDGKKLYLDALGRINTVIRDRMEYEKQLKSLECAPERTNESGGVRIY